VNTREISILIVDDDEDIRAMLCAMLSLSDSREQTCLKAANAEEAIRLLEASFFHLVLADIKMPGVSGLELCQHIHKNYPNTIVMMMSAMTDIQFAIEAMRQGAFDYLIKPFDMEEVTAAVERALGQQELLMAKHYCEQSLEEEIHDLLTLNSRLRAGVRPPVQQPIKRAVKSPGN
jgi:DNA-binding NtrC family response regulator